MGEFVERRRHPRKSTVFPVLLASEREGKVAVGMVQNASPAGLLVATARRLPVGEAVNVRFSDGDGGFTTVPGVVVRRVTPPGSWSPDLVAVSFEAGREDVPALIERAQELAHQNAAELRK
jgi:hypothetical protein